MNPLFLGIVIGLLLGVFLALGIAIWLNRAASPFVDREKPTASLPPLKPAEPRADSAKPATPASAPNAGGAAAGTTTTASSDKPRFEFYQILPGEKESGTPKKAPPPAKPADTKPAEAKSAPPAASDAAKPAKGGESLYLQAGAFQNETDAENLKAKIAFAGFEAHLVKVNVPDKGTLFRVRLGPYKSLEEVNRIKGVLSQNGIGTAIVKPD